jgi:small subunit ribosomal protein S1
MTQLATDRHPAGDDADQATIMQDEPAADAPSSGPAETAEVAMAASAASDGSASGGGAADAPAAPGASAAEGDDRRGETASASSSETAGDIATAGESSGTVSPEEPAAAPPSAATGAAGPVSSGDAPPADAPPAGAPAAGAAAPAAPSAARRQQIAERLIAAFTDKRPVEGKVIGWNKGGFHVTIEGVAAFCPRSLMELGNPRKPAAYLDQTFRFLITNVDEESRRIVVSRKEILEEERRARRDEVRKRLSVGAVLRGRVESLVDFGAFVDLDGGLKGLVHLSEISRKRIDHPKEALRNGQEVDVKVIKVEKGGDRISLSIRALEPDPWDSLEEVYHSGSAFQGKVVRHSEFGLFVEVADGIEGLVHTSQLPLGVDMSHPTLAVGETISGWVREVDVSRHRLSLTLRELPASDPWKGIVERYQEGQAVKGKVEHASKFGFFVELEPGLTGLLPFSEVSTPPGRRKENMYHPGQVVNVQILQLDAKRRRISLGSETSKVEGSAADYRAYLKRQQRDTGLNALAAAFEKLKR